MILLLPCPAMAQIIRGTVTDLHTHAPIQGANIHLVSAPSRRVYAVMSDSSGNFELVAPAGRMVMIEADLIGYERVISRTVQLRNGELLELDVRLSPRPIPLEGVDVVGRRPDDPRLKPFLERAALNKRTGFGKIWTRADLEKRPINMISQLLRTIPARRSMTCTGNSVFIDDLPVWEETDIDLLVAPQDLEGVEVYRTDDIPPAYLSRALKPDGSLPCMLTLLWRKPYGEGKTNIGWGGVFTALGLAAFSVVASILVR